MKTFIAALALVATGSAALPATANAGCLTGAAVGGVAGHVAGHHGILGAGAGCAVGHHEAVKKSRAAVQQQQPANAAPAGSTAQ